MNRRKYLALAVALPFVAVLAIQAAHYLPFLSDDSLISLRYARRLLEGQGLTWTAGRPVEGYSNLLWLLLIAALGKTGIDLVTAARALGLLGMSGTLVALAYWLLRRGPLRATWLPMTTSALFLSLGAPIAVWAIGGLEQPLYAALIAASIPLTFIVIDRAEPTIRVARWLSLVLGLLCLTRPDGPLFAATAGASILVAGWWSRQPRPVAHALTVLAGPAIFTTGQLVFRLAYYGALVPNTALVKIAPSGAHWTSGMNYVSNGLGTWAPFSWLTLAALPVMLLFRESRRRAAFLAVTAVAWSAYVAFIGGDIFPAFRQLVPLMVVLAFALGEGVAAFTRAFSLRPIVIYPVAVLLLAGFVPYTRRQMDDSWSLRAMRERWEWQGKEVALLLKQAFATQQPLMAVTAAGCLPYWSELPALDMMGLNDAYIARHPPANFGTGPIGHELGDGRYVFDRHPDLIVFDVGSAQPSWRSGDELNRIPEFHRRYVPVTVRTAAGDYRAVIFADKESEKIGLHHDGATIRVPGFLFTGSGVEAAIDANGRLAVELRLGSDGQLTFRADATRRWQLDRASLPAGVEGEVRESDGTVTIVLRAVGGSPISIEEVVLR